MVKYESTDYGYEVVHHDRLYLKKRYLIRDIVKVSAGLSINAYKIMSMTSGRVLAIDAVKHVKVNYTTNLYEDKGVKVEEMDVPVTLYVNLKPGSEFNKLEAEVKNTSIERMDDESYIITMNILIRPIYFENKTRSHRNFHMDQEDSAFEYSTEEKSSKKSKKSKKAKDSMQVATRNKEASCNNSNTQLVALILLLMLISMYVQCNKARCMYYLP